jgi:hypothetical protein
VPVDRRQRVDESAGDRNAGTFGKFFPFLPKAEKMTALSSIEYPHWLMIAGFLLLMLGFVGLALRQRGVEAEPLAIANDQGPSEPEADLNNVEVYNRTAKEKRRDRWAERLADEEPIDAKSKIQGST